MQNKETLLKLEKCKRLESQYQHLIQNFTQQVEEAEKAQNECKDKGKTGEAEQAQNERKDAVIFIGKTGSGKSTLVNWLNGAKFQVVEDKIKNKVLKMEDGQNLKFSQTAAGTKSCTLYPQYIHNENQKILTIDFPGFGDTRGPEEQLIIKMMYMDVVQRFDTRFVLVLTQETTDFADRASALQEIVKTSLQPKDDAKIESICLILNKFVEGQEEFDQLTQNIIYNFQDLSNKAKDDGTKCVYKALQQNIQIIEKIKSIQDYPKKFSDENREKLWQGIKSTKPIKIECKELEHNDDIGGYLLFMGEQYQQDILQFLNENWSENVISNSDIAKSQLMIQELNNKINEKADFKYFQEITQFLDELCKKSRSHNYNKAPLSIYEKYQAFFQLFQFFERFKKLIKGYKSYEEYIKTIQQYFTTKKASFQSQLEKLQEEKRHKQQLDDEKKWHLQQMREQKKEFEEKMEKEKWQKGEQEIKTYLEQIINIEYQLDNVTKKLIKKTEYDQKQVDELNKKIEQITKNNKQEYSVDTMKQKIISKMQELKKSEYQETENWQNGEQKIKTHLEQIINIEYEWNTQYEKYIEKTKYDQKSVDDENKKIEQIKNRNKQGYNVDTMKQDIISKMQKQKENEIKIQLKEKINEQQKTLYQFTIAEIEKQFSELENKKTFFQQENQKKWFGTYELKSEDAQDVENKKATLESKFKSDLLGISQKTKYQERLDTLYNEISIFKKKEEGKNT